MLACLLPCLLPAACCLAYLFGRSVPPLPFVQELTRTFFAADEARAGALTYSQFRHFMRGLGIVDMSAREARHVFATVDEADNGVVSFFEFCHFIFPDLDIEELVEQGDVDVPRLLHGLDAAGAATAAVNAAAGAPLGIGRCGDRCLPPLGTVATGCAPAPTGSRVESDGVRAPPPPL